MEEVKLNKSNHSWMRIVIGLFSVKININVVSGDCEREIRT